MRLNGTDLGEHISDCITGFHAFTVHDYISAFLEKEMQHDSQYTSRKFKTPKYICSTWK